MKTWQHAERGALLGSNLKQASQVCGSSHLGFCIPTSRTAQLRFGWWGSWREITDPCSSEAWCHDLPDPSPDPHLRSVVDSYCLIDGDLIKDSVIKMTNCQQREERCFTGRDLCENTAWRETFILAKPQVVRIIPHVRAVSNPYIMPWHFPSHQELITDRFFAHTKKFVFLIGKDFQTKFHQILSAENLWARTNFSLQYDLQWQIFHYAYCWRKNKFISWQDLARVLAPLHILAVLLQQQNSPRVHTSLKSF